MNKTKFTDTQIEDIEEALWIEAQQYKKAI